ncbi:MAG: 30S ribosomal protein S4 [Chloroflexi bacterium HGW-Chloroflexi-10]|nr:MAG: 30S ribosomal protein S4 [Chloroflexi bacterium HGW-Chloroflexi-10]
MARYTGPVCKLCRREGEKMFLKGSRCYSPKCAMEKRNYAPGQHGKTKMGRNERGSDYARQLRAKQRARRTYGILERQFRRYFSSASKTRGLTGLNLLQTLELRFDNVVYRMGLADSRAQARQLVNHGHFSVNGVKSDIPSMLIRLGDTVTVREGSQKLTFFKEMADIAEKRPAALWLDRDLKGWSGRVTRLPERAEIDGSLDEQLIVEYYSR